MKRSFSLYLLASMATLGFSGIAAAQTCASPTPFNSPSSGPTASGDTCAASDQTVQYCGGFNSSGKNDVVYQIQLGPSRTATQISISGGAAGFTPTLFMYSDACVQADNCVATGDTSTPADISAGSVPNGTYLFAITSANADSAGSCGSYTITANGTLPVKLQNFSIN